MPHSLALKGHRGHGRLLGSLTVDLNQWSKRKSERLGSSEPVVLRCFGAVLISWILRESANGWCQN